MRWMALLIAGMITGFSASAQQKAKAAGMDYDSLMQAREQQAVGKKLASFAAPYDHKIFTNEDIAGKTVFINLWFAACPPCMAEMESLNHLYDSLKANTHFEFISFTYDPQPVIDSVVKRYHIQYKILQVSQQDCYRLNLNNGFPASMIVDGKGIIKLLKVGGFENGDKELADEFAQYYLRLKQELYGTN